MRFALVTKKFGMVINERKTVAMRHDQVNTNNLPVSIGDTELQDVEPSTTWEVPSAPEMT